MATKLQTFTAQELQQANPQPPQYIIEQILPVGFVLLAAPPKTGKSWLSLSIADAVATGLPFWGFKTNQGACLYLALEDSAFRLYDRLKQIGSTMPNNLHLAIQGADNVGTGLIGQLQEWKDSNPDGRLIIIDTIGRVKGQNRPGMNSYESDTMLFSPLQQFAVRNSLCVLAVTHFSKSKALTGDDPFERITGSMGALGVADAALIIYGKRGEAEQNLKITGRDITAADYRIKFENLHWRMVGNSEALEKQAVIDAYRQSPLVRTIRGLVHENGRWEGTASDIRSKVWEKEQVAIGDVREIGKNIQNFRDLLISIDGIGYFQDSGGRNKRTYHFAVANQPML